MPLLRAGLPKSRIRHTCLDRPFSVVGAGGLVRRSRPRRPRKRRQQAKSHPASRAVVAAAVCEKAAPSALAAGNANEHGKAGENTQTQKPTQEPAQAERPPELPTILRRGVSVYPRVPRNCAGEVGATLRKIVLEERRTVNVLHSKKKFFSLCQKLSRICLRLAVLC